MITPKEAAANLGNHRITSRGAEVAKYRSIPNNDVICYWKDNLPKKFAEQLTTPEKIIVCSSILLALAE